MARCHAGRVMEVLMEALPSFLGHKDVVVDVPGLGKVNLKDILGLSLLGLPQLRSQWT